MFVKLEFFQIMFNLSIFSKRKEPGQAKRIRREKLRTKNSGHIPEKHKKRKMLRDPTFIFKSTVNKTESKTEKLSVKDLEKSLPESEPQKMTSTSNGSRHRLQGCGEQFRNEANVRVSDSLNMDDTTPEELAAYFDQLLHIPKPMSQMAEMMYT